MKLICEKNEPLNGFRLKDNYGESLLKDHFKNFLFFSEADFFFIYSPGNIQRHMFSCMKRNGYAYDINIWKELSTCIFFKRFAGLKKRRCPKCRFLWDLLSTSVLVSFNKICVLPYFPTTVWYQKIWCNINMYYFSI